MKNLLRGAALAVTLLSVGCVSDADKKLIQDQAAVGKGVLKRWDKLTDDQKKQAYWKSTRGYVTLDYTLFSNEVPVEFQKDPWAPAETDPVGSGSK